MRFTFLMLFTLLSTATWAQKNMKTIIEQNKFLSYADGTEKSFTEIIKENQGKVIYIDFWASWCGPCRKEMPASLDLHKKLKEEEIVFVYISIDGNKDHWKSSMKKMKIDKAGLHYQRDKDKVVEFLKFFYIYSIPHYMIIGKDGQIVNRDAAPPSDPILERQLRKLLKVKKSKKTKKKK